MAIPSFFKQNKPRGYNYMPRYYDPAREEREERLRAISTKHGAGSTGQGAEGMEHGAHSMEQGARSMEQPYRSKIVRGDMKNYFPRSKERVERHTLIRLLVIIMIMVLAIYIYVRFF